MKKRKLIYLLLWCSIVCLQGINAQKKKNNKQEESLEIAVSPKLVVGIVVDQMRYDYLTRFWSHYGEGGFKRLIKEGFSCKNNHFNYAPTYTGPGHASIYTGTTPSMHGIIANDWYDKEQDKMVYCAEDSNYKAVGTTSESEQMSPHRMKVTTITDQLRLHTQMKGKTIGISIKDRGAVLPAGHTANAAYWFRGKSEGNWVTSSFYMENLPKWVNDYNGSRKVDQYKKTWSTLKPISSYLESGDDVNEYEGLFNGEKVAAFPHEILNYWGANEQYDILKATPYGNSLIVDFSLLAIDNEALGKDEITDFLTVSFSSTDYVGHKYGVNSKEIQDTYLRLDKDLERLLVALDEKVGEGEYTVFLTADHGAIDVPAYLMDNKIPAGYVSFEEMKKELKAYVKFNFGTEDIIKNVSNNQIFLDYKLMQNLELNPKNIQETLAQELLNFDAIDKVYTAYQMWQNQYTHGIPYILQNGYNVKRSGDVLFVLKPGFINYHKTGSTHGSPMYYDTHVPLLFFGKGIKKGNTLERTEIPDIAPTIASLLGVAFPNGVTGEPITDVLE